MGKKESNVIDFETHAKTRVLRSLDDAAGALSEQKEALRTLDAEVFQMISEAHKSKDNQARKDKSIEIERGLVIISDWLEDNAPEANDASRENRWSKLIDKCEKLIARNERIKKTLNDDMNACRQQESKGVLTPGQGLAAVVSVTGGAAMIAKTIYATSTEATVHVAEVAGAISTYASFFKQIHGSFSLAAAALAQSPKYAEQLKHSIRFSLAAAAITASIARKRTDQVTPFHPMENTIGPKIVLAATL